jgi:hypothetical protein
VHSSTRLTCLTQPVDAASLGIFRIVFGAAVAVDAWRYLAYGWVREYYIRPKLHFTYLYFDFVQPWPGEWMLAHFWVMSILALCLAAGFFYRVTSILLLLAYTYVFFLEKSVYMNHHYLMVLLAFLLACMPAANAYSVDRARRPLASPITRSLTPRWTVLLLRLQLVVVYAYGALAKVNVDWLRGEPMYSSLVQHPNQVPAFARFLPPEGLAYGIAYSGLVLDAVIPLLLLRRRTFWIGFAVAVVFHVLNATLLHIGIFSYLMIGALLIFLPPDWPRRVRPLWRRGRDDGIHRRVVALLAGLARPQPTETPLELQWLREDAGLYRPVCLVLVGLYALVQILVPLRHLLYPGAVSWTEEGHRFAWHMKLRQKVSVVKITATDTATGRSWPIEPRRDLTPRQRRKLATFPDILLQYVHFARDRLRRQGIEPVITVDWLCSLNGRPFHPLVDPRADLAAAERTWRPAPWILPLPDEAG